MKEVFVFLANGFEEIEATATIDVLRRGDLKVNTVSVSNDKVVTGAHGIPVIADMTFPDSDFSNGSMLVLPGGMPGASNLNAHEGLKNLLSFYFESGKNVAAICAAPLVLGGLGILKGKKATCYPGFEPQLIGAIVTGNPVEKDGMVITGRGPGFAIEFALALVAELQGEVKANEVAAGLMPPK
ncbi:MAG: DJ-1/PfpI family protein [Dysgonamonadaceae bacterium]|jgi:4-methyl-5(b-hydroxyethyl)-thiazole monophosphate biosynthesis|nr:DJ-1/PfpI family protein [Dysgonamonadaceae bacterium]